MSVFYRPVVRLLPNLSVFLPVCLRWPDDGRATAMRKWLRYIER